MKKNRIYLCLFVCFGRHVRAVNTTLTELLSKHANVSGNLHIDVNLYTVCVRQKKCSSVQTLTLMKLFLIHCAIFGSMIVKIF